MVRVRPDWGAVLVDLRLHGGSQGFAPPHTVSAAAGDVSELVRRIAPGPHALLGHSFGGKVALSAASCTGDGLRQVWVIDSTPEAGLTGAGATDLLALLHRLPGRFADRRQAADTIQEAGFSRLVAEWMATNLERTGDAYVWRFRLEDMEELLSDFFDSDLWATVRDPPAGADLLFVRARRASIIRPEVAHRIASLEKKGFPVRLIEIDGGHWLNMDNPEALLNLLRSELPAD
jgi:pimeloyl-ACP methyl ester carboxylesterase